MLRELHITALGVIEDLDLEFDPGLNVLTGETGAGKTMITVGLALALGQRGSATMVRSGVGAARVQARFDATATGGSDPAALPVLRVLSFGLDEDAWPGIQTVEPQALVLDGALDTRLAKLLNHALDEAARERDWRGVLSRQVIRAGEGPVGRQALDRERLAHTDDLGIDIRPVAKHLCFGVPGDSCPRFPRGVNPSSIAPFGDRAAITLKMPAASIAGPVARNGRIHIHPRADRPCAGFRVSTSAQVDAQEASVQSGPRPIPATGRRRADSP